jgi:hypothetical protein
MEVYGYEVTKYDPHTREGGLFVDHMTTFLKLKAEACGYPSLVRYPEDDERYFETFCAREGVLLDRNSIRPNASKRGLAKLCLNSLWGNMAERQNRNPTNLISDPHELYRFLANPWVEFVNWFASDSFVDIYRVGASA